MTESFTPQAVEVQIESISTDVPFQVRVDGLDEDHVETLVAECEAGSGTLPPVVLTRRQTGAGIIHYLVDGHHEVEAQRRAGYDRVSAIVLDLTNDEAIDLAWDRNRQNARNLSLQDRVAHYRRLLKRQPPIPKGEIARICGLSRTTIWRLQQDVSRKHADPVRSDADRIVAYLRRIAVDVIDWDDPEVAAAHLRRAIPSDELLPFVNRLGASGIAALSVAEVLGYSP